MPTFLGRKITLDRSLVHTTQDLTFKVTHKVIKVNIVILWSLCLAFRELGIVYL